MGLNIVKSSFMSEAAQLRTAARAETRAIFFSRDRGLLSSVSAKPAAEPIQVSHEERDALTRLGTSDYRLVILGNEPQAPFGAFQERARAVVETRLRGVFEDCGATLSGVFVCPHGLEDAHQHLRCTCRRPMPGLMQRAAATMRLNLSASWIIGTTLDDVEAGRRAGCRTILIHDARHAQWEPDWLRGRCRTPDIIVHGIDDAARFIIDSAASTASASSAEVSA